MMTVCYEDMSATSFLLRNQKKLLEAGEVQTVDGKKIYVTS